MAALQRTNSRGAHFREDNPEPGPLETSRFTVVRRSNGTLEMLDEPVLFTRVKPGETLLQGRTLQNDRTQDHAGHSRSLNG